MKKIGLILVLAAIVISCGNDNPGSVELEKGEKVVNTFANGTPQIVREMEEVDGKLEAVYEKEYYDDGNLLKEGTIVENHRHGEWKTYYRDGQLWNVGSYDRGVRTDSIVGYYENGNVQYRGFYKEGQKSGLWNFYDENGVLTEKKMYMQPGEKQEVPLTIEN